MLRALSRKMYQERGLHYTFGNDTSPKTREIQSKYTQEDEFGIWPPSERQRS